MSINFNTAVEKTLRYEGGYVNDPQDKGGETKYGISKRAYPNRDIKNLTEDEAKAIYKRDYWDKIGGDMLLSDKVAFEMFDTAVNMGVKSSIKLAQLAAGVEADGTLEHKSIEAINGVKEGDFLARYKVAKVARYVYICKKNPDNKKFFYGWISRTMEA